MPPTTIEEVTGSVEPDRTESASGGSAPQDKQDPAEKLKDQLTKLSYRNDRLRAY